MTPNQLELASTEELIAELMCRPTFMGIIVHSKQEIREPWTQGVRAFRVRFNDNLDEGAARRLLAAVSEQFERREAGPSNGRSR
jgi:hypothetical protein